jgi:hypothetical protein
MFYEIGELPFSDIVKAVPKGSSPNAHQLLIFTKNSGMVFSNGKTGVNTNNKKNTKSYSLWHIS